MRARGAGLAIGLVFGVVLSWSALSSPNVIRDGLLFERSYLFLVMASAMLVATTGSWILRRIRFRAILTGQTVGWAQERPERRHVVGALIFGVGWGVADACPGPIATQLGQGIVWGLWTLAGVVAGVTLFLRRQHAETEPASDTVTGEIRRRARAQAESAPTFSGPV